MLGVFGGRKTGEPGEKPPEQGRDQSTYDTGTGNRTRATLVGGECSHHSVYAVPAPLHSDCDALYKFPSPQCLWRQECRKTPRNPLDRVMLEQQQLAN